MHYDIIIDLIL